jgi:hypothetical protein
MQQIFKGLRNNWLIGLILNFSLPVTYQLQKDYKYYTSGYHVKYTKQCAEPEPYAKQQRDVVLPPAPIQHVQQIQYRMRVGAGAEPA